MKFRGKPLIENALSPAIYSRIRDEVFASVDEREIRMCKKKQFFRLESHAQKALDQGIAQGYLKETAYVYRCDFCIGWHRTNGIPKEG